VPARRVLLQHPNLLNDDAVRRLKAQWDNLHSGVDNWAKTAILEEGMTATQMQLGAEEMQYIQSRQLNREECCAAYDVPPPWCTFWSGRRSRTSLSRCGRCTGTRWRPGFHCSSL
jgi:phage portal protein BeeE